MIVHPTQPTKKHTQTVQHHLAPFPNATTHTWAKASPKEITTPRSQGSYSTTVSATAAPSSSATTPTLGLILQRGLGDICGGYLAPGIVLVARKLYDSQKGKYKQTLATSTTLLTTLKYTFPLLPLRVIPKFHLTVTRALRHHPPHTPSSGPNTSTGEGKPNNRVLSVAADATSSTLITLSPDPDCDRERTRMRDDGAPL